MAKKAKCKHLLCECDGDAKFGGYCSEICAEGHTAAGRCICGHPPCKV
jgi:hypothetical protein